MPLQSREKRLEAILKRLGIKKRQSSNKNVDALLILKEQIERKNKKGNRGDSA